MSVYSQSSCGLITNQQQQQLQLQHEHEQVQQQQPEQNQEQEQAQLYSYHTNYATNNHSYLVSYPNAQSNQNGHCYSSPQSAPFDLYGSSSINSDQQQQQQLQLQQQQQQQQASSQLIQSQSVNGNAYSTSFHHQTHRPYHHNHLISQLTGASARHSYNYNPFITQTPVTAPTTTTAAAATTQTVTQDHSFSFNKHHENHLQAPHVSNFSYAYSSTEPKASPFYLIETSHHHHHHHNQTSHRQYSSLMPSINYANERSLKSSINVVDVVGELDNSSGPCQLSKQQEPASVRALAYWRPQTELAQSKEQQLGAQVKFGEQQKGGLRCNSQIGLMSHGPGVASVASVVARRKNATRESTAVLRQWLDRHIENPYPSKGEKIMLNSATKMNLTQISTWFANARRRMKKERRLRRLQMESSSSSSLLSSSASSSLVSATKTTTATTTATATTKQTQFKSKNESILFDNNNNFNQKRVTSLNQRTLSNRNDPLVVKFGKIENENENENGTETETDIDAQISNSNNNNKASQFG